MQEYIELGGNDNEMSESVYQRIALCVLRIVTSRKLTRIIHFTSTTLKGVPSTTKELV